MRKVCLAVILIMFQAACTSMEAVQRYASSVQSTIDEVQPVAKDYHSSCLRIGIYEGRELDCAKAEKASLAISKVATVLNEYGGALQALAADEIIKYNEEINSVTSELENLGLDKPKADAVGSLANFLAKWITSGYQQKEVSKFIDQSHDSVERVSNVLAELIEENYTEAIRLEHDRWEKWYMKVKIHKEQNPIGWEIFDEMQREVKGDLEKKKDAAAGLGQAVRQVGVTHRELKEDSSDLDSKEVKTLVRTFIGEVKPVIKEVEKAF